MKSKEEGAVDLSGYHVLQSDLTLVEEGSSAAKKGINNSKFLVPPGKTLYMAGIWSGSIVAVCPQGRVYVRRGFTATRTKIHFADSMESRLLETEAEDFLEGIQKIEISHGVDLIYPRYIIPALGAFPKRFSSTDETLLNVRAKKVIDDHFFKASIASTDVQCQFISTKTGSNRIFTPKGPFVIFEPGAVATISSGLKHPTTPSFYLCSGATLTIDSEDLWCCFGVVCPGAVLRVTRRTKISHRGTIIHYPGAILDIGTWKTNCTDPARSTFNLYDCGMYGFSAPKWIRPNSEVKATGIIKKLLTNTVVDFSNAIDSMLLVNSYEEIGNTEQDGFHEVKKVLAPGASVLAYGQWKRCEVVVCAGASIRFEETQKLTKYKNTTLIHVLPGGTVEYPMNSVIAVMYYDEMRSIELKLPVGSSIDVTSLGCLNVGSSKELAAASMISDSATEWKPLDGYILEDVLSKASTRWRELDPKEPSLPVSTLVSDSSSRSYGNKPDSSIPSATAASNVIPEGVPMTEKSSSRLALGLKKELPEASMLKEQAPSTAPPLSPLNLASHATAPPLQGDKTLPSAPFQKSSSAGTDPNIPAPLDGLFKKRGSFIPTWRLRRFTLSRLGLKYSTLEGEVRGIYSPDQVLAASCTQDLTYPHHGVILECNDRSLTAPFYLRLWFHQSEELRDFMQSWEAHRVYFKGCI